MCGIFGCTKPDKDPTKQRAALQTLKHRGPDQWADSQDDSVYLGHRRLSIMDLSEHGRQPMTAGHITITVNGEIYNFKQLRSRLEPKYKFQSNSDSEVLIHGYAEWGMEKLLNLIEGMYAFALYDLKNNKLFLVRDRVGVKPLYYSKLGDKIAWASELKALEKFHGKQSLKIDTTAIYDYLTYLYIPAPKTMYKCIYKLEPAHYLEIDLASGKTTDKTYWKLNASGNNMISSAEAAKTVRRLVQESVNQQLMSDVPVGFFLSGGMDSSTVVAAASKVSSKLHTYSIGFDVREHSETHFAELVAKKFKTKHLSNDLSAAVVKEQFHKLRDWYDEPFADTSAFPVYLVSSLAKATSTVVLTGDGGDEVFGGYNWYTKFKNEAPDYVRGNSSIFKRRSSNTDLELEFYSQLMTGLAKADKKTFREQLGIQRDYDDYWYFRKYYRTELPILTRLQYMDFHTYLPDDILTKVDRASMSVALECRVPLLATPLIEFMFSLPEEVRYKDNELKGLMKYAFKAVLPPEIIGRDKKGFSIPTGRWKEQLMETKTAMPKFILEKLYPDVTKASV